MLETITDQRKFHFSKESSTTLAEFDKLFEELFNRTWVVFGKEYNLPKLGWKRDYNRRIRSLGLCAYRFKKSSKELSPGTVFISKELLSRNLDKAYDFEDTIRHEIAHAIHCHISGRSSHDRIWKAVCREVGADDTRLHEGFLETPKGKYSLKCVNCKREIERYRIPKKGIACGSCCNKYNRGRYSDEYKFEVVRNH